MISTTLQKERAVGVSNLAAEQYEVAGTGVIPEESAFSPPLVKILKTKHHTIQLTAVPDLQTSHTAVPITIHEYSKYVLGIFLRLSLFI